LLEGRDSRSIKFQPNAQLLLGEKIVPLYLVKTEHVERLTKTRKEKLTDAI
jgi:hypothetical protein